MKILEEDYRKAKNPLGGNSKISLCEEESIIYDETYKKEVKIKRLFLLCRDSSGLRFSTPEIEDENKRRIKKAAGVYSRKRNRTRKKATNE